MSIINDQTKIGLANRFVVTVDPGSYNLGSFQKAEGLDVSWEMPDYRAGDSGNQRWFFPANTKYSTVKLIRAVSDDSKAVRDWLNKNSFHFDKSRCLVTIQLFESTGTVPLLHWELHNAQVKKWSINNMDAGASAISVETLEFDHEGFLEDHTKIG
jgi:phage tail-like protein